MASVSRWISPNRSFFNDFKFEISDFRCVASANPKRRLGNRGFAEGSNHNDHSHFPLFFDKSIRSFAGRIANLAEVPYKVLAAQPKGRAAVAPRTSAGRGLKQRSQVGVRCVRPGRPAHERGARIET